MYKDVEILPEQMHNCIYCNIELKYKKDKGFELLRIWTSLFEENEQEVISKMLNFINEKTQ